MSVFLTNSTYHLALSVMRSLGKRGIDIMAGDVIYYDIGSRYCKKYVKYPNPDSESFIDVLYDTVKKSKSDALFPMGNATLMPISKNKKRLEEITSIPIPDFETVIKAYDKYETYLSAIELGIPTPRTYLIRNEHDLTKISSEINYPLIMKPRMSNGSSEGVSRLDSPARLRSEYSKIKNVFGDILIQEYIPGNNLQMRMVNVLYNLDSEPIALFTAKKLREYPITGGITTLGESTWEPRIAELGARLFDAWKWRGVAEIEFKVDPTDNTPKLIEVNPRFWSYLKLPMYCGIDFPYLLYKVSLGENVEPVINYKIGARYIHPFKDAMAVFRTLQTEKSIKVFYNILKSYRGVRTNSILSLDDPLPVFKKTWNDLIKLLNSKKKL